MIPDPNIIVFAVISDAVQIALIAGITAAVPAIIVAVLGYMASRKTAKTVDTIHTLVNSQMGEQLKIGMTAAMLLAKADPTEANKALALEAERKCKDHDAKQAKVDAKEA